MALGLQNSLFLVEPVPGQNSEETGESSLAVLYVDETRCHSQTLSRMLDKLADMKSPIDSPKKLRA